MNHYKIRDLHDDDDDDNEDDDDVCSSYNC